MRSLLVTLTAALVALAPAAPCEAGIVSVKAAFVKDRSVDLPLQKEGIQVRSYRFDRPRRGSHNTFNMAGEPTLIVNVVNAGSEPRDFSIAAALYDREGNLVGAGSGGHTGKLKPGEEQEIKVVFRDVTQNVAHAVAMQMSLETQL